MINNEQEEKGPISGLVLFMRKMGRKLAFLKVLTLNPEEEIVKNSGNSILLQDNEYTLNYYSNLLGSVSRVTRQLMIKGQEDWVKNIRVGDWIEGTTKRDLSNDKSPPILESFSHLQNFNNWTNESFTMSILNNLRDSFTEEENRSEDHQQSKKKLCQSFKLGIECTESNCDKRHFFINDQEREQNYRDEKDPYCGVSVNPLKYVAHKKEKKHLTESPFSNADLVDSPSFNPVQKMDRTRRAQIFAKYLVDKFGKENLKKGCGVLDVAGGKGEVSYYLLADFGIASTVVDPRQASLSEKQLSKLNSLQLQVNYMNEYFTSKEEEWKEDFKTLVQNCSCIIGLHPDQATEPILDISLKYQKPFSIVPCCVFPSLFPDRKLSSGEKVVNYASFITYLMEKDSTKLELDYLPVMGMNKIILHKPMSI